MTPNQAQKIAIIIQVFNMVIALSTITGIIMLVVDQVVATPQVWNEKIPERLVTKYQDNSLNTFRFFWQASILPNKPRTIIKRPKLVVKKTTPKPQVIPKPPITFKVIATVTHSDDNRAHAILEDTRARKQLLVRKNDSLPNSKYKIAQIKQDQVLFYYKEWIITVNKEVGKSQKKSTESTTKPQKGIEIIGDKIIVADNLAASINNLKNGDQIISVNGSPVQTIEQFYSKINASRFAKILVMRNGEKVSVYVLK
ncbi:hypothetical protein [Candidatus Uabimicrobium sp. HlEnr_7]|uniref:hypothetical protein n=1 Tax=Candidatus Uabimicrobium helgolandensis TaxID=3095367 RepID=UPI003555D473